MEKQNNKEWFVENEAKKWRNLAIVITIVGVILFALPIDVPHIYKVYAALPLFAMFVYVYYKYIGLREAAKEKTKHKSEK